MDYPRLSEKEYIVLDFLRNGTNRFGLEMVKESGGALKRGTIYVLLNRMSEKGYVTSKKEATPADPGMPRRMYSITGYGQRALQIADMSRSIAVAPDVNYGGAV